MTDIDFETTDSPQWGDVKDGTLALARDNLQNRVNAVATAGVDGFRHDAKQIVHEAIVKPPGRVSGLTELLDIAAVVCEVVLPEEGVVAEVYQAAKVAWETIKPSAELAEKINARFEANTVDQATQYLEEMVDQMCEDIATGANEIKLAAEATLETALVNYVNQNPQVFQPHEQSYYQTLCNAIGVPAVTDVELLKNETVNRAMQKFKPQVLEIAAAMHFFHEMDDDFDRLNFLIDDVIGVGTDPDQFLQLIGADQAYWDQFLTVFRSEGKDAAEEALRKHLMGY